MKYLTAVYASGASYLTAVHNSGEKNLPEATDTTIISVYVVLSYIRICSAVIYLYM